MGWRFVRQPNGLLARFSEIVDDFTHYDLTPAEALEVARDKMSDGAEAKVGRADEHSFAECIETITHVHGAAVATERIDMLSRTT